MSRNLGSCSNNIVCGASSNSLTDILSIAADKGCTWAVACTWTFETAAVLLVVAIAALLWLPHHKHDNPCHCRYSYASVVCCHHSASFRHSGRQAYPPSCCVENQMPAWQCNECGVLQCQCTARVTIGTHHTI